MEQLCPEHYQITYMTMKINSWLICCKLYMILCLSKMIGYPEVFIQINTEAEQCFSISGAVLTMQSAPQ